MVTHVDVRPMRPGDADPVLAIYQAGLDSGDASFETAAPPWEAFDSARLPTHRFVCCDRSEILGWVAVSAVSTRLVYAGVVEHSGYVDRRARGRGVGRPLLDALIASTEAAGVWTIQSGVFPENAASLALHRAAGFRVVGTRERVGRHHGRWRDVVLVERRSATNLTRSSSTILKVRWESGPRRCSKAAAVSDFRWLATRPAVPDVSQG
jgi:phosphinothricin acetyltransferase